MAKIGDAGARHNEPRQASRLPTGAARRTPSMAARWRPEAFDGRHRGKRPRRRAAQQRNDDGRRTDAEKSAPCAGRSTGGDRGRRWAEPRTVIRRGKSAAAGAAQPPAPVAMAQTPTIDTCLWPIPSAPTRWAQALHGCFTGAGGRRRPPNLLQSMRVWMQAPRAALLILLARLRAFRQASPRETRRGGHGAAMKASNLGHSANSPRKGCDHYPCRASLGWGGGRGRRQAPARRRGRQRAIATAVWIDGQEGTPRPCPRGAHPHAPRAANAGRATGQILDPIRDISSPRHVGTPERERRAPAQFVQRARNPLRNFQFTILGRGLAGRLLAGRAMTPLTGAGSADRPAGAGRKWQTLAVPAPTGVKALIRWTDGRNHQLGELAYARMAHGSWFDVATTLRWDGAPVGPGLEPRFLGAHHPPSERSIQRRVPFGTRRGVTLAPGKGASGRARCRKTLNGYRCTSCWIARTRV